MNLGFDPYYKMFYENRLFNDASNPLYKAGADDGSGHCDEFRCPFVRLKEHLEKMGHKVSTIDMDGLDRFDAVVFIDFPGFKNKYFKELTRRKFKNMYLLIREVEIHQPINMKKENHSYFKKIFTWHEDIIDNKKYFRVFNACHEVPDKLDFDARKKKKLCAFIGGHKFADHPLEMYTERIRAIRWFEKNHPEDFDLYGTGWDEYQFKGKLCRLNGKLNLINKFVKQMTGINCLNLIPRLLREGKPLYPSYRGTIRYRSEVLPLYKFFLCYHNYLYPGWITESIFYSFVHGCVPIYLGAPNITDYVPGDTFVNKRDFKTYEELYGYIKNMPESEYMNYLDNIAKFLKSDKHYVFSVDYFAETLSREILNSITEDSHEERVAGKIL